jgi:hypothetical protein
MDYLHAANEVGVVWAVKVQDGLWQAHLAGTYDLGRGISAMPSIHVSAAVLFALLAWRVDRRLGIAFTIYAAVIMIGSVHLAWHYAIDGYLSVALRHRRLSLGSPHCFDLAPLRLVGRAGRSSGGRLTAAAAYFAPRPAWRLPGPLESR